MTIVYLHGLNSSPATIKGRLVAQAAVALPDPPRVHLPQLHQEPARAVAQTVEWVDANVRAGEPLAFIGSSLGGFYATHLAERYGARAVVINPAVRPCASLETFLGPQRNLHTGASWTLTREHLAQLDALRVARITRPERYFLLVRSDDELLDWKDAVSHYAGGWQYVAGGGDHGWAEFAAEVPSVLRFALRAE